MAFSPTAMAWVVMSLVSSARVADAADLLRATRQTWDWEFLLEPTFPQMFGQVCQIYTNSTTQNDQLLVYAGYHHTPEGPSNDMYRYDFVTGELFGITQHGVPGGSIPWKRDGSASILNANKTVMMVFGGSQAPAEALGDTWELDLSTFTWREFTEGVGDSPSRRYGSSIVWLEESQCALLFGGAFWLEQLYYNDLWCYSFIGHIWSPYVPNSGSTPAPRFGHTAICHEGLMYVYGGGNKDTDFSDVWVFNTRLYLWGEVLSKPPPSRSWMQGVVVGSDWVIVGGARNSTDTIEVWKWPIHPESALGGWENVTMGGEFLSGRMDHCLLNHNNGSYVYMLGGFSYEQKGPINDFVRFSYRLG